MKRFLTIALLLVIIVPCLNAQRKEIGQARTFIKSGKNLDKAEQLMRNLLKDNANRENEKIHVVLCDALRKQYEERNLKMYLKQKQDTASFFLLTRNMFMAYESLDSLDARPNAKGKEQLRYREKNAAFLNTYRRNLYNGGLYFVRKQQYATAYDMLDTYIDCARQPLFTSYRYPVSPEAAYWSLFCGYKLQDDEKALRYAEVALEDEDHQESALEYLSEIYKKKKATEAYEKTLRDGFTRYPDSKFFFTYLIDYYNEAQQPDSAMSVVNSALAHDSENELYLFAKSNLLLNTGDYTGCIALCDSLIARNDQYADAYYNAGLAYINMALITKRDMKEGRQSRRLVNDFYKKSMPYMERYRELAPEEKDKWAAALYNIYLQLNMGKQFEEIDKLLR